MSDDTRLIDDHYGGGDVSSRILSALRAAGKNPDALTREDLASLDEFHSGGREATRTLARLAALRPGQHVLDVGSGVGGPARTLAAEFGCTVTGIDLTDEFCRAADMLTERLGMRRQVRFRRADALDLPFDAATFDVVWSQNAIMNIADKARLFAEARRVLRSDGLFALQTVLAGPAGPIHFPVFWADGPALSFLATADELTALLTAAGFRTRDWQDVTAASIASGRRRREATAAGKTTAPGVSALVTSGADAKAANSLRNYEEGRTIALQAVCTVER